MVGKAIGIDVPISIGFSFILKCSKFHNRQIVADSLTKYAQSSVFSLSTRASKNHSLRYSGCSNLPGTYKEFGDDKCKKTSLEPTYYGIPICGWCIRCRYRAVVTLTSFSLVSAVWGLSVLRQPSMRQQTACTNHSIGQKLLQTMSIAPSTALWRIETRHRGTTRGLVP